MGRFVRPDTRRLTISNGDWLLVRKRLSFGEQRAAFARMVVTHHDGSQYRNPLAMGIGFVTAYLLDWSLTDEAGSTVDIRGVSVEELTAVLDTLSPDAFAEIKEAIEAHEAAMTAEDTEVKKTMAGTPVSDPISPSPSGAIGGSTGSVN